MWFHKWVVYCWWWHVHDNCSIFPVVPSWKIFIFSCSYNLKVGNRHANCFIEQIWAASRIGLCFINIRTEWKTEVEIFFFSLVFYVYGVRKTDIIVFPVTRHLQQHFQRCQGFTTNVLPLPLLVLSNNPAPYQSNFI